MRGAQRSEQVSVQYSVIRNTVLRIRLPERTRESYAGEEVFYRFSRCNTASSAVKRMSVVES